MVMTWNLAFLNSQLRTASIGKCVVYREQLDSTNAEAKRQLAAGAGAHGTVIIAGDQTQGRGRYDRQWISFPSNLAVTVMLSTTLPLPALQKTPLVVGLALYKIVKSYCTRQQLRLKWPNDLLINDKKCAGILIETIENTIIMGIGVNIDRAPDHMELRHPATSLYAEGVQVDRERLLAAFLNILEPDWLCFEKAGFAAFRAAYEEGLV